MLLRAAKALIAPTVHQWLSKLQEYFVHEKLSDGLKRMETSSYILKFMYFGSLFSLTWSSRQLYLLTYCIQIFAYFRVSIIPALTDPIYDSDVSESPVGLMMTYTVNISLSSNQWTKQFS